MTRTRDASSHRAPTFSPARSLAIEDEVDEVTNLCDGGSVNQDTCMRRVAYSHLDKDET